MISSTTSSNNNKLPSGYRLLREGKRAILVRDGYEESLRNQGLLNPSDLWKHSSPSDHLMGRGEILLVKGKQGKVAVRKYRHGGLLRRLTGDLFFFGARPFQETAITEEVKSAGVPTVKILAAIIDRKWGRWYRGYLITRYLPTATDLISYLDKEPQGERRKAVIEKAAEAVKKMHQGDMYHADLHLKNFLVDEKKTQVFLIDFDKSEIFPLLKPSARMKNLKRLDRSVEKLTRLGLALTQRDKKTFCRVYTSGDREIRPYVKSYVHRYRWYQRLYRWGWWIARILYPRSNPRRKSIT
jgi:3-deoxy-D-manno-octulosonic acid kinase